jgi:hypothetical protein
MFKTCQFKTIKYLNNKQKEKLVDNPVFINIPINKKVS